jgi:hypothetical protein
VSIAFDRDRAFFRSFDRALQGIMVPFFHRLMRYRTMHYELTVEG